MQSRDFQSSISRAAISSRFSARSLSNSDDTFVTARTIGSLRASSTPITIRTRGKLSQSDRVDFFKFTIVPGADFPSYTEFSKVTGGRVRFSVYFQHPDLTNGEIQLVGAKVLKGTSSATFNQPTNNGTSAPITVYGKATLIGNRTTKYDSRTTYNLFQ